MERRTPVNSFFLFLLFYFIFSRQIIKFESFQIDAGQNLVLWIGLVSRFSIAGLYTVKSSQLAVAPILDVFRFPDRRARLRKRTSLRERNKRESEAKDVSAPSGIPRRGVQPNWNRATFCFLNKQQLASACEGFDLMTLDCCWQWQPVNYIACPHFLSV